MSAIAKLVVAIRGKLASLPFEAAALAPTQAQHAFLSRLLRENAQTSFGVEHQFRSIRDPADYQKHVPIRDYEGFRPYVDRLVAGERQVLTEEEPLMFTTTSGTTSKPKLVPVTVSWKRQLSSLVQLWMGAACREHRNMLSGKLLAFVSPAVEDRTEQGMAIGSVSGLTAQRVSWLVRRRFAIPYDVVTIRNYDRRYFVSVRMAMAGPVGTILTPNPSTLLRLAHIARDEHEAIIRAIHDGHSGISPPPSGPFVQEQSEIIRRIEAKLSANPKRARELEKLVETHGTLRPRDAWPGLALIGCWLGGSAGIQSRLLQEFYGDVPMRDLGYRATEGTMTIPLSDATPTGVLAMHANFYEFIPVQQIEQAQPDILLAHELEEGKQYYILLSTSCGLYRYDINDIVEVRGFYKNAPLIAFIRKGRDMANITGEKLHINQVMEAASLASQGVGVPWIQIQTIPDVDASVYDLLLEPEDPEVPDDKLRAFIEEFDLQLRRCNPEYEQKRNSGRLHLPRLHRMRSGWAERRRKSDVQLGGKRDAQYKWPIIRQELDDQTRQEILASLCDGSDPPPTSSPD